ncbi:anti-sigma factor antagonist [[Actinomadura] parvosata subsp. kistnae]|uniref:STAS domain-containing protein n=1 Tax=[Actinomadura] parvosata subsp. kistnae TaxID=1909395 RepID=A0A1U9ZWP1_9ACTN|nr:STAS domain-containing protein [Nonomuraea sp. ATCC 55076]AQZ62329.1 hypothetical protein BKM31_13410 [Nonomuraea sp. ATCC 55076]SPL99661.1 anti-sigma factor antagonist [Actinomadura parvosata subsp. kistnae]
MVIIVAGELDVTTSQELETYLDLVRRSLDDHLVVDAGRLSFLGSSGLTVLLAAAILAQARGAAVHLVGLQPRVARRSPAPSSLSSICMPTGRSCGSSTRPPTYRNGRLLTPMEPAGAAETDFTMISRITVFTLSQDLPRPTGDT